MMKLIETGTTLIVDRYAFSGVAFTAAKPVGESSFCKIPARKMPMVTTIKIELCKAGTWKLIYLYE